MKKERQDQLKRILQLTRPYWDRDETRPSVRHAFNQGLLCGTPAMGGEVYASENEEKIVSYTCKGKACSSCGHRGTVQWQRERWSALPNVPYYGITFTMPDVLWHIFHDNPVLARTLPILAADVIQTYAYANYGVEVGVIAILHTFNGKLEFNSHVHTMVLAGGLLPSGKWFTPVYYDDDVVMEEWRYAVIALLRTASRLGRLGCSLQPDQIEAMLSWHGARWWSVNIELLESTAHFLGYAGRYVRRPPIAQWRISHVDDSKVRFWVKDKKLKRKIEVECTLEEFIDRWSQHIPDRYRHSVRYFGLFAPRGVKESFSALFAVIGQKPRPRPKPRLWRESIRRDFGFDPLLDHKGVEMKWTGRIAPQQSPTVVRTQK